MQQIKLPVRRSVHWFLTAFFGIPFAVFLYSYITGAKAELSLRGVMLYAIPALACFIVYLPVFSFKLGEKEDKEKVLLTLPVSELTVIIIIGITSVFCFTGITYLVEGHPAARTLLVWSLPLLVLLLYAYNNDRVWFKDQLLSEESKQELERKKTTPGYFVYTEGGFSFDDTERQFNTRWNEIESIIAFKSNNYTCDTVHLAVRKENGDELVFSEDTPGWFVFTDKIFECLPGSDAIWMLKVITPDFEESITSVYIKGKDLREDNDLNS